MGYSLEDARRIADGLLLQCDGILVYALLDEPYWTPERQRAIVADAVSKVLRSCYAKQESSLAAGGVDQFPLIGSETAHPEMGSGSSRSLINSHGVRLTILEPKESTLN
ncbi:TetR family transcriptional regulator C-terminal domain-containing protein [Rhizobium sp. TRM96647]|uniref:TetR family transcriptional regulator C-terminal domain-containing protein n=1 Tax=unclassified Rhizobium TaxID=2613769 RepID=UPI0021E8B5AE|nr:MULTISPECIES: TetR family transcriptional regulator C-terminal domain-containing protein [unclassified Rhizobium]MCV3739413.1 TetR family transcriptional regulator C-terminal domain-containing protein [Rhizobium sp. TRM96647]MCV3761079.1 TetR family transcriptional regulator C-terminal domain-containing protein [Rhizobium sp. TRM96650]